MAIALVALVFTAINAFVAPVIKTLSLPFIIITLGFALLVINALLLLLTEWITGKFGVAFHVDGFWWAVLGSIVISIVNAVLGGFTEQERRTSRTLTYRIALVCLGNICRSPMAHVVLEDRLAEAGLDDRVEVASSGTGDWHVGHPMDPRAAATLSRRGIRPDPAPRAYVLDRTGTPRTT